MGNNNKIRIIRVNENYQSLDGAGNENVKKAIIGLRPSKKMFLVRILLKRMRTGAFFSYFRLLYHCQ